MSKKQTIDMVHGNPFSIILRYAIPLVLGSIFQQLYNFVDTAIVGRCISVDALSAVGVTGAVNFLVLGFTMGSAMGFGIPIAQSVGAESKEDINRFFWNGLYLSVGIGVVISVIASIFVNPLLKMIKTPTELFDMAATYLRIIFLGQVATVLYNYLAGVLRAFGDSKRPFYFLLISSALNVVLDLVFVLVIPLGVAGVAVATVISQVVSVVICTWWLSQKNNTIHKADEDGNSYMVLSKKHLKTAFVIGVPLGLEYSVTSIGNVVLQGSINALGSVAVAAQICGERIRSIATLPLENVGMAIATYVGQNYGAKNYDRIRLGIRSGMLIQVIYCGLSWVIIFMLKKPLVYLLLGELTSAEARASLQYLSIVSTLFICHGTLMVFRNAVQSMGHSMSALIASVMEIIGRASAGLLAVHFGSFLLICVSAPSAWAFAAIPCIILYLYYINACDKLHSRND